MRWVRAVHRFSAAVGAVFLALLLLAGPASAVTQVVFSTGDPNNSMAMASRPGSGAPPETEAGDDFPLVDATNVSSASFVGLLPSTTPLSAVQQVDVEIYRIFPADSDVTRTTGPPTFSTSLVPTRVNSPSDVEFEGADSGSGQLSFTDATLASSFTALNSVDMGINPKPNQTTAGDGQVTGEEVSFNVTFTPPLSLPAGHYFFVPQVQLSSGHFLWLSGSRPIVSPGTPFPSGVTDLQAWIRNANLEPDWLRVGTDIASSGTFNGAFSVAGVSGCPAVSVSPASPPTATLGTAYSTLFAGSGGSAPYTFDETGALPPGLSFAHGVLSGTPTQAGSFEFAITATDAQGCTGTTNVSLTVVFAGTGGGGGGAAPVLSAARLSSRAFRAAVRGPSLSRKRKPPVGTRVSYKDSEAARTTFTVLRARKGHRRGGKCVSGKRRSHQKSCTRYVKIGSFAHRDKAGNVSVHFSGRVRGHKLPSGRYRLTLKPKLGTVSGKSVNLGFRIVH